MKSASQSDLCRLVPTKAAPLRKPWKKCIAVGRAYDLLRQDHYEHLQWIQNEIGFAHCRFHGVFEDNMGVVKRTHDGRLLYCWHQVDKAYDSLLKLGLKPFVELNSMPVALASGSTTIFHYEANVTPPKRWEEWGDLVKAFAGHLVDRYGAEEVRQWHFEVWNEPNLACFWTGTQEDYFQLYAVSAHALKSVDAGLRVGGPATSKASWIGEFIEWCAKHAAPLDFITTHLYPQDEYTGGRPLSVRGAFFGEVFRRVQNEINASSMPGLPIHWTEWNPQSATGPEDVTWSDNEACDNAYGGAFVARQCLELDESCDSMAFWVASDIFEEHPIQPAPFSATYGMLNIHGVPKASANAFRLLNRMKGASVARVSDAPYGCGGVVTREGSVQHAFFYHCQPPGSTEPGEWRTQVRFEVAQAATITQMRVEAGRGSAYEWWCNVGRPLNLSSAQSAAMMAAAQPECRVEMATPVAGGVCVDIHLAANSFVYIEICPAADSAPKKSSWVDVRSLEAELSGKTPVSATV
jgi:xylan 1,4-beta-xylosidase